LESFIVSDRQALGLWLDVTARAVRSSGPDLTARQTALMLKVYLEAGPHTVRGLATQLGVGKPAIVRAIDTLEEAGLVQRVADTDDRRNVFIEGTEKGAESLAEYARFISRSVADLTQLQDNAAVPDQDELFLNEGPNEGHKSGPATRKLA
jgi:DNA-binding MarR family transcriptional regulator